MRWMVVVKMGLGLGEAVTGAEGLVVAAKGVGLVAAGRAVGWLVMVTGVGQSAAATGAEGWVVAAKGVREAGMEAGLAVAMAVGLVDN